MVTRDSFTLEKLLDFISVQLWFNVADIKLKFSGKISQNLPKKCRMGVENKA
jgi:hypothetical protein